MQGFNILELHVYCQTNPTFTLFTDLSEVFVSHDNPAPVDEVTQAVIKEAQNNDHPVQAAGNTYS